MSARHSRRSCSAASQVPDEFKQGEVDEAPLSPVGGDIKIALEKGLSRRPDEKELVEVSIIGYWKGLTVIQLVTQSHRGPSRPCARSRSWLRNGMGLHVTEKHHQGCAVAVPR